ncbi:hypothetical protein Efla_004591 [Eimeria flavescens]
MAHSSPLPVVCIEKWIFVLFPTFSPQSPAAAAAKLPFSFSYPTFSSSSSSSSSSAASLLVVLLPRLLPLQEESCLTAAKHTAFPEPSGALNKGESVAAPAVVNAAAAAAAGGGGPPSGEGPPSAPAEGGLPRPRRQRRPRKSGSKAAAAASGSLHAGGGAPAEGALSVSGGPPSCDSSFRGGLPPQQGPPEEGPPQGSGRGRTGKPRGTRSSRRQGEAAECTDSQEQQQERLERAVKSLLEFAASLLSLCFPSDYPTHNEKELAKDRRSYFRAFLALPEEALSAEILRKTPRRVARTLSYFTKGYSETVEGAVGDAVYEAVPPQDFVAVKDLEVTSVCEHHLLPFFGRCHIVYLPGKLIVGLSKLPRIIEVFERRLQMQASLFFSFPLSSFSFACAFRAFKRACMQERLTAQVADGLEEALAPRGVLVMMECTHACMSARGVGCRSAKTVTLVCRGEFERDPALRKEALALIS